MSECLTPRWRILTEQLKSTPSIKLGMTEDEELLCRQKTNDFVRQIGNELRKSVTSSKKLCPKAIHTAMVFIHRFYVYRAFQHFPGVSMAPCALFLAAKVEETPVKLEYVIKTAHIIKSAASSGRKVRMEKTDMKRSDLKAPELKAPELEKAELDRLTRELMDNEKILLETLGFELCIYHPHRSVVQCGDMITSDKDLIGYAFDLVTNSLHFSTMCLKYEAKVIACVCLNIALKAKNMDPGISIEGKCWWHYLDEDLTSETMDEITNEYLETIKNCNKAFQSWIKTDKPDSTLDKKKQYA